MLLQKIDFYQIYWEKNWHLHFLIEHIIYKIIFFLFQTFYKINLNSILSNLKAHNCQELEWKSTAHNKSRSILGRISCKADMIQVISSHFCNKIKILTISIFKAGQWKRSSIWSMHINSINTTLVSNQSKQNNHKARKRRKSSQTEKQKYQKTNKTPTNHHKTIIPK